MTPDIRPVPPGEIKAIWKHVEAHFASFAARTDGEITAAELFLDVVEGNRQCWVAIDGGKVVATAITQLCDCALNTVEINFCAGSGRHDWRDEMVAAIAQWARTKDSKRIRIICRPGWAKELKRLGFKETHRVLERELDNG